MGGLYYRIINKLTGKALGVAGASIANGAAIEEWDYLGSDNQKFQLLPSVQIAVSANTPGAAITLTGNGCSAGTYTAPATVFAQQAASCALSLSTPRWIRVCPLDGRPDHRFAHYQLRCRIAGAKRHFHPLFKYLAFFIRGKL